MQLKCRLAYDEFGNPNHMVDSHGNIVDSVYDANGRVKDVTAKVLTEQGVQNLTTSYVYDNNGRTTQVTDQYGNVRKTEYNSLGQITFTEDSLGNRTQYFYDNKGRLTDVILPDNTPDNPNDNPKTNTKYDNAGNVIEETSATGLTTRYVYDELGRLSQTILPDQTPNDPNDNPKIITKYTAAGRIKEEIDIFGKSSRYWYDDLGRLEREQDVLGNYSTYTYNRGGQIETVTDAKDRTTRFVYDDNARAKETILFDGSKNQVTYDELGRLKTETNQLGQTITYEYDKYGQVKAVINALNERTEYAYDQRGKLIQVTDALQHSTKLEYDKYGRQVATIADTGERSQVEYDRYSRVISETDANQHKKQYFYNNLSQLTTLELADQTLTNYTYDIYGRLTAVEDANKNITQYEYDKFNRQIATVLPMGQRSQTDYNNLGLVESYKDFNSDIINYAYDQYGRLDTKSFSNPNVAAVSYTYDSITSQIATVTDGRGVTRYGYDNYDRLASIINPDGQTIGYSYDVLGNLTSQTTSAGTVNYTYDSLNRLDKVIVASRTLTDYDYNAVGSLIRTTNANGTVENRQYNERNQLKYLDDRDSAGNIISSYSYTLDAVGYRTQVVENTGRVVNYIYDNLDRLTQEKITDSTNGDRTIDYTFDLVGNRLTRTDSAEGLTTYIYDGNNRLTSSSLGSKVTQFTYDNNGSMTSRSDGTQTVTYDWINDGENRLVGVTTTNTNGTSHQQYIYDASGDRVASIADGVRTNYLVDPMRGVSQVLLEYDANSQVTAEYTYGLGLIKSDRSGDENYYHTDGLGSTRILTNSTGQVVDIYTYDAYGRLLSSTGTSSNSYQFAGEQRDSQTGLDYLRARYYDADLGRFISKDSFAGFMDDPMSQNSYQYADANPVNFIDPTGHETMGDIGAALSIIASLAAAVGVGAGAGYLTGSALNGASGEDLLNLTDQWVAGFADAVTLTGSTRVRRWLYGEVAEQNHSGFMWNMGQVAGAGAAMMFGAAAPENLTFSMGREKWLATTYDAIGTGVAAWNTGTHIRERRLEWTDAFTLAPLFVYGGQGVKQLLGAAIDANGALRHLGRMEASAEFFGSCFVAGTKVLTPTSEKNIESIVVGDTVVSADPESGEIAHHQVKSLFKTSVPVVLNIKIGEATITCSPEHPFWVPGKGWQEAGKLKPGTLLLNKQGQTLGIESIERREGHFTVYNIEVEGLHTYFVSDIGILVHNKAGGNTASADIGKAVHRREAEIRRYSGDFDNVNQAMTDKSGNLILVPKEIDLKTGLPKKNTNYQTAIPDAVNFEKGLILDDKPLGRPLRKDRQEIIRFINAYQQREGKLPNKIAIQRYEPKTGQLIKTDLHDPSEFLP